MKRGGKRENSPWIKSRRKSGPKKAKTGSLDEFDDGSSPTRVSTPLVISSEVGLIFLIFLLLAVDLRAPDFAYPIINKCRYNFAERAANTFSREFKTVLLQASLGGHMSAA